MPRIKGIIESTRKALDLCTTKLVSKHKCWDGAVCISSARDQAPILWTNEKFHEITGYTPEDTPGLSPLALVGPATDPAVLGRVRAEIWSGRATRAVVWSHRKDGTPYWSDVQVVPVLNLFGKVSRFVSLFRDVTEEALRSYLGETIAVMLEMTAGDPSVEACLEALEGVAARAVPDVRTTVSTTRSHGAPVFNGALPLNDEVVWVSPEADRELTAPEVSFFEEFAQIAHLYVSRIEIERERATAAAVFGRALERMSSPFVVIDPEDGSLIRANEAALRALGADRMPAHMTDAFGIGQLKAAVAIEQVEKTGGHYFPASVKRDPGAGSFRSVQVEMAQTAPALGGGILAHISDTSAIDTLALQFRDLEAQTDFLLRTIPDGVARFDFGTSPISSDWSDDQIVHEASRLAYLADYNSAFPGLYGADSIDARMNRLGFFLQMAPGFAGPFTAACAEPGAPASGEIEVTDHTGTTRTLETTVVARADALNPRRVVSVWVYHRDTTAERRLERDILQVTHAEQDRLASDLHDGVGQHMHVLHRSLSDLRVRVRGQFGDRHPLTLQTEDLTVDASVIIEMFRTAARSLSPFSSNETEDLHQALNILPTLYESRDGAEISVHVSGDLPGIPHPVSKQVYCVAAEAVTNATRHGRAENVSVSVRPVDCDRRGGCLELVVVDDGCGFDPETVTSNIGLNGFRSRARSLEGSVRIQSAPGQGARIEFTVPIHSPITSTNASLSQ